MAIELEELRVILTANNKEFDKRFRATEEQLKQFARESKRSSDKVEKSFMGLTTSAQRVKKAIVGFASIAAIKGLTNMSRAAMENANVLRDTAQKLGVGTEELQKFQFAAMSVGVGVNAATVGLQRFVRRVADAAQGGGPAAKMLRGMNIELTHMGKMRAPLDIMGDLAEEMKNMDAQGERVLATFKLFDTEGVNLVNLLMNGRDAFFEQIGAMEEWGGIFEEQVIQQVADANTRISQFALVLKNELQMTLMELHPVIELVFGFLLDKLRLIKTAAGGVRELSDAWKRVFENPDVAGAIMMRDVLSSLESVGFDVADSLEAVNTEIAQFDKAEIEALFDAAKEGEASALVVGALIGAYRTVGEVTDELRRINVKYTADLETQIEKMEEATGAIGLTGEALIQYEAAIHRAKGASDEMIESFIIARRASDAATAAFDAQTEATKKREKAEKEAAKAKKKLADANKKSEDSLKKGNELMRKETQIMREAVRTGKTLQQTENALTEARLLHAASVDGLTENERALVKVRMEEIRANQQAKESLDEYHDSLEEGIDISGMMEEMITGLARGTLKLKDFMKQAGQTLIAEFAKSFLFGKKEKFDLPIKANMLGLVGKDGIIGSIFKDGALDITNIFGDMGGASGKIFGINFAQTLGGIKDMFSLAKIGDWGSVFSMNPSMGFGKMLHGMGTVGAGMFGFGLAEGIKGLFGFWDSKEASMGGKVGGAVGGIIGSIWGPVGSFVGSFIGDMIGSFIGSFFAHTPTKGTQIRKAVRDWLKDLGVVYAEELDRKNYFFEETKALADKMGLEGGAGFLVASKKILQDSGVRAELQNQLVALGTAITKDMAEDLGKNLEQTGVTFANMIIDNLGGDEEKIGKFIADLIDKSEMEFGGLVGVLNDAFEAGSIGAEHYRQAIEGAATLFFHELPDGIDVAKIALDSFTEDGVLDLELFEEKLTEVVEKFKTLPGILAKIREMLVALAQQMLNVRMDFIVRMKTLGAANQMDVLGAQEMPIRQSLDTFYKNFNFQFPVSGRAPWATFNPVAGKFDAEMGDDAYARHPDRRRVTVPEMMTAIENLGKLQDIMVAQFQERERQIRATLQNTIRGIQETSKQNQELIKEEYNLKRAAQQEVIDGLNTERSAQQELFQERLNNLQTDLQIAQAFQQTANSLRSTVESMVTGAASPLSAQERFGFLESRAAALRGQLQSATLANRPQIMSDLSGVLQSMLGVGIFQRPSPEHAELFNNIVTEIEALQEEARIVGETSASIEQQILTVQTEQKDVLAHIENRIAQETAVLQSISEDEQRALQEETDRMEAAIHAATASAEQQIDALRQATIAAITDLQNQQIEIGRLARIKLAEAEQAIVDELEALGLPTDRDLALITTLGDLNATIEALDKTLKGIRPAARGFTGTVHRPTLFLAGENGAEHVQISPRGSGGRGVVFDLSGMNINTNGSSGSEATAIGKGLARVLLEEYRNGPLGREIRADMERH